MRDALVFDYDGVIADTEPLHWKSWAELLSRYGIGLGWEDYCAFGRGISDGDIYAYYRQRAPLPGEEEFAELIVERKRLVRAWSLSKSPISAETVDLLYTLGAYRVGLVTSSDRAEVEPVLRAAGIEDRFNAMVFGGEAREAKPSPAPYQLIAERLGIETGVALEDSEPGLESARAAGFEVIKIEKTSDVPQAVTEWLRRSQRGGFRSS